MLGASGGSSKLRGLDLCPPYRKLDSRSMTLKKTATLKQPQRLCGIRNLARRLLRLASTRGKRSQAQLCRQRRITSKTAMRVPTGRKAWLGIRPDGVTPLHALCTFAAKSVINRSLPPLKPVAEACLRASPKLPHNNQEPISEQA